VLLLSLFFVFVGLTIIIFIYAVLHRFTNRYRYLALATINDTLLALLPEMDQV